MLLRSFYFLYFYVHFFDAGSSAASRASLSLGAVVVCSRVACRFRDDTSFDFYTESRVKFTAGVFSLLLVKRRPIMTMFGPRLGLAIHLSAVRRKF